MSCFDPKDIPQSLLPPGKSRKEEVDAIGTLKAYAFVSRQPATAFLDMHRLIHLAMRNWLKQKEKSFSLWMHKAVTRLDAVFPLGTMRAEMCGGYTYRMRVVSWDSAFQERRVNKKRALHRSLAFVRITIGGTVKLRAAFRATETHKTKLRADHPDTLTSMANLASTYRNQGRWEEAERLEVQVMETRKTKLGADHPSTLTSMSNLASTYNYQGRWEEAERLEVQLGRKPTAWKSSGTVPERDEEDRNIFTFKES
ncbi:hypothetical protein MY3296_006469 [Beauveria thailandica]